MKNQDGSSSTYSFEHFEVRDFSSSQYHSHNHSTMGRILNCLINALNEHNTLPKLIVVVLDDDIAATFEKSGKQDIPQQLHRVTRWLVWQFDRAIKTYNDYLPVKSKKFGTPHVLWISPPMHIYFGDYNNQLRVEQGLCLSEIIKTFKFMSSLQMLKVWDHEDHNAFIKDSYRFTAEGKVLGISR